LVYSIHSIDNIKQQIEIDNKKIQEYEKQKQNKQNPSNSSFNILLIDDDKNIIFTYEFILKNESYNVTSYSNSNKALDHFSNLDSYHYDLIVTDIRMPGFNGFQFYRHIKVFNTDTKVLFLSAFDVAIEIMIASPGLNADDIIVKPIDLIPLFPNPINVTLIIYNFCNYLPWFVYDLIICKLYLSMPYLLLDFYDIKPHLLLIIVLFILYEVI
jgi:CheY-like chemotaxis protein